MTLPIEQWGGAWSDQKLAALSQYLTQYTNALKHQPFELHYIDAFAGAGTHTLDSGASENFQEDTSFRHGSPLVAIQTQPGFDKFTFIEFSSENLSRLRSEIQKKFPNCHPTYLQENANDSLARLCEDDWIRGGKRGVIFLDPFAVHLKWQTIQRIARTQALDMWLLFPAMAVNRMLPQSGSVPQAWKDKLTETFGTDHWEEVFYRDEGPDLFSDKVIAKTNDIFSHLTAFVVQQLQGEFAKVVEKPLVLKTSSGSPLFLLCFASGNPKGAPIAVRIAEAIIRKV